MNKMTGILIIGILIVATVAIFIYQYETKESTQKIKKFSSIEQIDEFLKATRSERELPYIGLPPMSMPIPEIPGVGVTPGVTPASAVAVPANAPAVVDYSKTNIQVEGVDEADFVKNDNKYIYILAQNKLVIVDAYPAENASITSETKIPGRLRELFINKDKLVVFAENDYEYIFYPEYEYVPVQTYIQNTNVYVYDISDRTKPEIIANYSIKGNYFQSRMIGNYVYFIVKDSVYSYYDYDNVNIPVIIGSTGEREIKQIRPDIYYFDNPEQDYMFHTIISLDLKSLNVNTKSFMIGYSDNLYVSDNNIYITYRKNIPYTYQDIQKERFYNAILPQLPKDIQEKIQEKTRYIAEEKGWNEISSILKETYSRMDEKEKQEYLSKIRDAIEEYDIKLAQEREKTVIQKINIDRGNIEYKAKGEVPGTLLNQFSMDESSIDESFRVATTTQFWSGKSVQFNNIYILDKDLHLVGKLEKIAPDEMIYSTRFIENRLYMVTFRRIDPLFVIDLSNPEKPEILGKLKIPGYSDYLHPYDENRIIGIGKETADNEWGGASIKGVKLSLFDVSDVDNPRQLDKYEIGSTGSDSEALRDHKAFLFDKNKGIIAIPIVEPVEDNKMWQGVYVLGINLDGFRLKGKVPHLYINRFYDQDLYWGVVRRSIYIDDILYTMSSRKILMNELQNLSQINVVELPFERSYQ